MLCETRSIASCAQAITSESISARSVSYCSTVWRRTTSQLITREASASTAEPIAPHSLTPQVMVPLPSGRSSMAQASRKRARFFMAEGVGFGGQSGGKPMKLTKFALAAAALAMLAPAALADGGGGAGPSMGPSGTSGSTRADPTRAYQAGVAAIEAQNYREAIRELREARRAAPNDGVINYALGVAYVGAGETNDARSAFERAVRAR